MSRSTTGTMLLGFITLGVLLAGAAYLLFLLWGGFSALSETARAAILASMLTVGGTVTLGIYAHQKTRQREIEQALYEKKQPVYEQLLDFLFKMMAAGRQDRPLSEDELMEFFMAFSKELILWGSDDVIRAYIEFRRSATKSTEDPKQILMAFEALFRAIRLDFGHKNKDLAPGALISFIITDSEEILQSGMISNQPVLQATSPSEIAELGPADPPGGRR